MKMYNEFQKPLKDATDWKNPGSLVINFSADEEPENYTDLWVGEDEYSFADDYLTDDQFWAVDAYAKKVQAHLAGETAEHEEHSRYLDEVYKNRY